MEKFSAKIKCRSCEGTGVYQGFAEPIDTGVVCLVCGGTGCEDFSFSYTPFTKRGKRKDVKWVSKSRGTFVLTGVGPHSNRVSYSDFLKGKMP